jgi:DNA-binding NarL/FixJ family response regulator
MTKTKSYIKDVLNNWYIISETSNEEIRDLLIQFNKALQQMDLNGELSQSDVMILEAFNRGFNYKEIAMITKLTRQTVSTRIEDISKRLETILGDN